MRPIGRIVHKDGDTQTEVGTAWAATNKEGELVCGDDDRILCSIRLGANAYKDKPNVETKVRVQADGAKAFTLTGEKGEGFLNLWIDRNAIAEAVNPDGDSDEEDEDDDFA